MTFLRAATLFLPIASSFFLAEPRTAHAQEPAQLDRGGDPVSAALPRMYRYAFRFQAAMEKQAAEREKNGGDGAAIRNTLQFRFNLTGEQFAPFEDAATRYGQMQEALDAKIEAAKAADRAADRAAHPATPVVSNDARAVVYGLLRQGGRNARDEMANLRRSLDPLLVRQLDDAVARLYRMARGAGLDRPACSARSESYRRNRAFSVRFTASPW